MNTTTYTHRYSMLPCPSTPPPYKRVPFFIFKLNLLYFKSLCFCCLCRMHSRKPTNLFVEYQKQLYNLLHHSYHMLLFLNHLFSASLSALILSKRKSGSAFLSSSFDARPSATAHELICANFAVKISTGISPI